MCWSQSMQRWALLTLTTEGGYYAVMLAFIIAGAMIRDINLLYVMAGMMLGPLVFNAWHTFRAVRSLEITRSVPSLVGESDQVVIDVTVMKRHQRNQSYALVIEDQLARDGVRAGNSCKKIKLLFPVVSGREESKASYR